MDLENRKRKKEQGWKLTKLKAFKLCHLEGWTDCTHWLILGIAHSQHVNKQQVKLIEITPVFQVQHKIQLKTSRLKVIKLVTCSLPLTLSHHHAMAINQKCRQFTMSMRQSKSSFGIQFLEIELFTQIYAISHVAWNIGTMLLVLWTLQKSTCFPMNGFYKGYYCYRTVLQ